MNHLNAKKGVLIPVNFTGGGGLVVRGSSCVGGGLLVGGLGVSWGVVICQWEYLSVVSGKAVVGGDLVVEGR